MLEFFNSFFTPSHSYEHMSVAQTVMILFLVIGTGILLGKIRVRGISLGISAVMFSGILFGHLGYAIPPEISEFLKDFGLMLFVYAIGIQVGPYFFSSFKNEGLKFNVLAVGTVIFGGLFTLGLLFISGLTIDNMVGIMSGAVTNTPGLGAAKSTLNDIAKITGVVYNDPANGYALTYAFGVLGVIVLMILGKFMMKIDLKKEDENFAQESEKIHPSPLRVTCRVTNMNMVGKSIAEIRKILVNSQVHITRIKPSGSREVGIPHDDTLLKDRDVLMMVGKKDDVNYAVNLLGRISTDKFIESDPATHSEIFVVTNNNVLFRSIAQLHIQDIYDVRITRVIRGEIEFMATENTVLLLGDRITVVGHEDDLVKFEKFIGNREKRLNEPDLIPISIGAILGAILGAIPWSIPFLGYPLKLGMAAGPLIIALWISRYSTYIKVSPYLHKGALLLLKDVGIALFFATVGLKAGSTFYSTLVTYNGWTWIGYGLLITVIPMLVMMLVGRYLLRINFLQLIGLMAATYTDPAALAFGSSYYKSDIPNQSYATVYPLVTIARIIVAQVLVLMVLR